MSMLHLITVDDKDITPDVLLEIVLEELDCSKASSFKLKILGWILMKTKKRQIFPRKQISKNGLHAKSANTSTELDLSSQNF